MQPASAAVGRQEDKHRRIPVGLALICTVVMLAAFFTPGMTLLDKLECRTVDWRFRHRGVRAPTADIIIVAVDEESIGQAGKWPWPRRRFAKLTERLAAAGARAIVYDVFFVEPDDSPGGEKGDEAFVAATREAGQVYHATFGYTPPQTGAAAESSAPELTEYAWAQVEIMAGRGLNTLATFYELPALIFPFPALAQASAGLGFTDVVDGGDGVFRYVTPVARYGEQLYPSLGLAVAANVLGVDADKIIINPGQSIDLGDRRYVPIDRGGRMAVNFTGPNRTYRYLSAHKLLGTGSSAAHYNLEDTIAIVGVTAPGLYDLRACPFGGVMNGVEIQANIIDNLINAHFLKQVAPEKMALLIVSMGMTVGAMFALVTTWWAVSYALGILVGYNLLCTWAFASRGLIIDMLAPSLTALLTLLVMLIYKLAVEERQRHRARQALSHFVPAQIVSQLVEEEALTTLRGQRRVVSVLFCDLRNFTPASERLAPEDTVNLLNRYFQLMHEVIWEFGGTLDKFLGDALMAFFNAPLSQADHALLAVRSAIEMQRRIRFNQAEWEFYGMPQMQAGIGISTGEALVGCVSSQARMQYTVIGSHVNLASRLEELTKQFEEDILISEATYQQVRESVEAQMVGEVTVRGFAEPVKVYGVKVPT